MVVGRQFEIPMIFNIPKNLILELLKRQLNNFFLLEEKEEAILDIYYDHVLERCEQCFSQNIYKYYHRNGEVYFNPYHSVQYMTFLYYFSHTIYVHSPSDSTLCDKIYYLNKMLNAVDILYAVELPDFFMAEHPVGSVMGRARIDNGFMFFQNCTVGGVERRGEPEMYPVIGKNVHLYAGASIIGACKIGNNVSVGAGALIKNQDVPDNSIVFGQSPYIIIKNKQL